MTMQSLIPRFWPRGGVPQRSSDPFAMLQREMNRLFDMFGQDTGDGWRGSMAPALDVSETDKEIEIDADLPGVEEKDIEVTLSGDTLTIRGQRKNGHETRGENYYLAERSWGSFTRQVRLPFDADPKHVSAKFDKGVLHIAIAKPEDMTAKTARIPVKAA